MEKQKAIEKLQQQIDLIGHLKHRKPFSPQFKKWHRDTQIAIERIFRKDGRHLPDFTKIRYNLRVFSSSTSDSEFQEAFRNGLDNAGQILKSMIDEITEWGIEQDTSSPRELTQNKVLSNTKKIFVVHGRDDAAKQSVARYIEKLDLEPVILHEQANEGRTIIEKFEDYSNVGFAVVLMTPDDIGALSEEKAKLKPRARQNVILELGFFLGKLGRQRVCALYKQDVQIPSDYKGVLFIPMDASNGWQLSLAKEMKAVGIAVDLNLVF
jgi:predicted nucleotide-binding protein